MKYFYIGLLLISLSQSQAFGQRNCNAPELFQNSLRVDPETRSFFQTYLEQIRTWIRNYPINPQLHRSPITIPVVVHVVHNSSSENLPDAVIRSQITAMNKHFMKLNTAEINARGHGFKNQAAKSYIQFRLARRKPNGDPTNGIIRKRTSKTRFIYNNALDSEKVKRGTDGVAAWDTDKYLNMWVCDLWDVDSVGNPTDDLLGYATFPWDRNAIHGVVMDYTCFGTTGSALDPAFSEGITTSHEVGHFLGLFHTFEGGCTNTNDEVSDTPPQSESSGGVPSYPHTANACSNTGSKGVQFMNFMDYSDDAALCLFTSGQVRRMLSNLAPNGAKASLAVSNAMFPPNARTVSHEVFLEASNRQLPAWKASLAMLANWAWQQSTDVNAVIQDNAAYCSSNRNRIRGLSNEVSDAICGLAMQAEEILMCYSIDGFYEIIRRRPITLLSIRNNEYYGLTISGMVMDRRNGTALLSIKDPMGVGPRLGINQRGAEYNVNYADFMTNILERLVEQNTHSYIVYPPRRVNNGQVASTN